MSASLLSIGTALPRYSVAQGDAAEFANGLGCGTLDQASALPRLYERAGIERRGSVLLDQPDASAQTFFPQSAAARRGPTTAERMARFAKDAPLLALHAARDALAAAGRSAADISHLLTVTSTGFVAPGLDIQLIAELGLASTTPRSQIGFMGCQGAINGLRLADALARTREPSGVLLCAVELCTLHFGYDWDPATMVANALFADGAAAAVVADAGPTDSWRLAATGSYLFPDSADAMAWRIGDHGFEICLSPRVPKLLAASLRGWMETWLASHGLRLSDVRSWAVHPGGPRVLDAVAEALDLSGPALRESRGVLTDCGNMSSPTILFVLRRLQQRRAPAPCVALGFGPGLVAESVLLL